VVTRVKICGITRLHDALHAVEWGADALGFVFTPRSPRFLSTRRARGIIRELPPFVIPVGVFVDAPRAEILAAIQECGLGAVQLHGRESPAFCGRFPVKVIKAFRVKGSRLPAGISSYGVHALLLDTYERGKPGGTGLSFPWEIARRAGRYGRVILAGGLNPGNVVRAIETARPYAVDVSSGVESRPGVKDPQLLRVFLETVKGHSFSGRGPLP